MISKCHITALRIFIKDRKHPELARMWGKDPQVSCWWECDVAFSDMEGEITATGFTQAGVKPGGP